MEFNKSINEFLKEIEINATEALTKMQVELRREGIPFDSKLCDELVRTFRERIDNVHDGFEEAQIAAVAETSKKAPIETIVLNPSVSEVEAVRDGVKTISLDEATKLTPDPKMKIDVFGDIVTQSKESMPMIEMKQEPIDVSMIFSNFDNKRFYCYHCLGKNDLGEAFSIITDVHSHWIISHMQSAKPVPFLFVISDCFACHVCGTIQIYHDLLKHANNNHPAIIVDKIDQKQCALCAYNGNDIIQHFQKMHKSILKSNSLNPMRLTAEMFEELLTIDVHKQLECEHCQQLFDTKTQVQLHHKIKHSTEKVSMKKVFNNQVIYLICGYCDQKVETDDYFSHVTTHTYPWKCLHCDFHAIDLDDLMEHDELEHLSSNIFDEIFKNHSNLLEMNYFQTKVVFGNGLVLIKHNLIGTKVGDRPVFDQFMIEYENSLRPKIDNAPPKAIVNNKAMESDSDVSINEEKLSPVSDDCVITDVHQEENNDLKEQNILDKNVSIYGIPNSLDSELNEVISNLCKTIGTNLTSNDIRRIYRLPGELNEVIINFKTYEAKSEFMHAKWPTDQIELAPDVQISSRDVRHHMTDFYLSLSAMVCKAKEKNLIVSCELTRRGIAFKRTDSSETEYIRTEYEAQKILNGLE